MLKEHEFQGKDVEQAEKIISAARRKTREQVSKRRSSPERCEISKLHFKSAQA